MHGLFSRRELLRLTAGSLAGLSASGWMSALAQEANSKPRRACILLWMSGGPSQIDTFDMKPQNPNGGPFKEIQTDVPGIRISEHLPQVAGHMSDLAIIRSMRTKEGDHARATYLSRTGYLPQGPVKHPTLGSSVSKEIGTPDGELPNFVSIAPFRSLSPGAFQSGFLGPQHAPLTVGSGVGYFTSPQNDASQELRVKNLSLPADVSPDEADARLSLLEEAEREFRQQHPAEATQSHASAYRQAVRLMRGKSAEAFQLEDEPDKVREAYGDNLFGQGCLLARRLVERGVPFVEVSFNQAPGRQILGWDTHADNFDTMQALCQVLDPAWATLLRDLKDRDLLDSTLVVWMGEFGRTPQINRRTGRDHFPAAWTTVLSGGGTQGGQVIGKTSENGREVVDRPVSIPDLLATVCSAVGVDPLQQNITNMGRPMRIVDPQGQPIEEVLS